MDAQKGFTWYLTGFVLQVAFFGVSLSQAFYYLARNRDAWPWRLFATILISCNIAAVALVADSIYFYLIRNFGKPTAMDVWPTSLVWFNLVQATMGTSSQLFFAFQIYQFSRGAKIVSSFVVFQSLASFAFNASDSAYHFHSLHLHNAPVPIRIKISGSLSIGLAVLGDLTATVAMCVYLRSMQQGVSTKRMQSIINRIFIVVINRGLLVTLVETAFLFFVLLSKNRFYWECLWLIAPGLYVNTTFSILNSRVSTQSKLESRSFIPTYAHETTQRLPSYGHLSAPDATYWAGSNFNWDSRSNITPLTTITSW